MQWLVNQARTYKSWVLPLDLQQKLEKSPTEQDALMISIVGSLLSPAALQRIYEGEMADPENNYKLEEYVSEAISTIFEPTIKGKQLSADDLILQAAALAAMTSQSGLSTGSSSKKSITIDAEQSFNEFMNQCSDDHALCGCNSFFRINFGLPTLPSFVRGPIMTNQLREVLKQYKRRDRQSVV